MTLSTSAQGYLSFITGGRADSNSNSNLVLWVQKMNSSFLGKVTINNGNSNPTYELEVTGNVAVNGVFVHSDKRWKKNIETIDYALDKVLKLRGVSFEWRSEELWDKNFVKGEQIGFIAQEVEDVVPEVVVTDNQGYKLLDYSKLTALLIEAVKELKTENKNLEKRVEILEGELGAN